MATFIKGEIIGWKKTPQDLERKYNSHLGGEEVPGVRWMGGGRFPANFAVQKKWTFKDLKEVPLCQSIAGLGNEGIMTETVQHLGRFK